MLSASTMRRVLVIGGPGSGKSTVARALSGLLNLPLIHLDQLYWSAGWRSVAPADFRARVEALATEPEWVMDGNYFGTFDLRAPCADTLVWLDPTRATCVRRVLWRTLTGYGRTRPDGPEGCPERFDLIFFQYVWQFAAKHRPEILDAIGRFGHRLRVVQLRDERAVDAFLATVKGH